MHIFYRASELNESIHGGNSIRPNWFDKKKCFKSLINSLNNSNINFDITVILDNACQGDLELYLKQYNINIIPVNYHSHIKSLLHTYNLIDSITDNEHIYLVEDDYLHTHDAITILNEGINKFGIVTCYDHPDRYFDNICESVSMTNNSHWRTSKGTTQTFAFSRNIYNIIKEYLKQFTEDMLFFEKCKKDLNITLWSSIIGRSTHVNKLFLSPFINWEQINSELKDI